MATLVAADVVSEGVSGLSLGETGEALASAGAAALTQESRDSGGGLIVRQTRVTVGETIVHLQFIFMERSVYVWAGMDGNLDSLAVAMPPKFVS